MRRRGRRGGVGAVGDQCLHEVRVAVGQRQHPLYLSRAGFAVEQVGHELPQLVAVERAQLESLGPPRAVDLGEDRP